MYACRFTGQCKWYVIAGISTVADTVVRGARWHGDNNSTGVAVTIGIIYTSMDLMAVTMANV